VALEDLDARDILRASEDLDAETLAQSAEHAAAEASRAEVEDLAMARPVAQSAADLTPDSDLAASIDDAIDQITAELAAFCFEQLERSVTLHNALDLNTDVNALEDEFWVRHYMHYIVRRPTSIYSILAIQIISVISDNAQRTTPDITRDSEQPSHSLDVPAIEAAQVLFLPEEDNDPADIMEIIQTCLKDVKKHNSKHTIKSLSQLIAVSEYIKLRAHYNTVHLRHASSHASKQAWQSRIGWARALISLIKFDTMSCTL
jgi:hypothetical protein